MLLNSLVKVLARVANIACIAQATLKMIHSALLIYKGWLVFPHFYFILDLPTCVHWADIHIDLPPIQTSMSTSRTYPRTYRLSFFQKLVLCRGLNFALPQRISPREIQATFEKAYWKLEPKLSSDYKELAAATLRSIALNYSERKRPAPPKAMLRAISQLKKRNDIVVTKPDKGS